jgi:hypothetical protein
MASIIKSYSIDKEISDGLKHVSKPVSLSVLFQIMIAALVYQIKHPKCDHKELQKYIDTKEEWAIGRQFLKEKIGPLFK